MRITQAKVQAIVEELIELAAPSNMTPKERDALAKKAGLSPETLRTLMRRRSLNADTLVRLLLAQGVSPRSLTSLSKTQSSMTDAQLAWLKFGRTIRDPEKLEVIKFIKGLMKSWILKK